MTRIASRVALAAALALAACSKESETPTAPTGGAPTASAGSTSPFALAKDPGEAVPVKAAKDAGPKDEVVVVGRVKDFVKDLAAFTLIDTTLDFCGAGADTMDGCETPWDYCCIANETIAANTIAVEAHGKDGNVVSMPKIPELRNLDLVAVKGRLVKDADGNPILEATGWYRRERPNLGDHVKFP